MASVQGVYIAIFGRPADPGGLAYWNGVTNNGADLSQMIAAFTDADEFRERYEGQTSAEIVTSIYQALFGREPDAEGLAFYSEALENGDLPIESIAVSVLDGAQNEDQQRVQNKEAAADKFTASLDTPEEIAAYSGENAENYGEEFLNKVTDDPETVPTDEEVEQATDEVEALPPEGQAPQEPEEPEEPGNPGGGGGGGNNDPDYENSYGDLSENATFEDTNQLFAGKGNPSNGFVLSTNTDAGIQLGLDARYAYDATEVTPNDGTATFEVDPHKEDDVRFAYSVDGVDLDNYDYKLLIDVDGGSGTEYATFNLVSDTDVDTHNFNNSNSSYDWLLEGTSAGITDDGGNDIVTQNVQKLQWYTQERLEAGDEHTVTLQALEDGTNTVVAESEITIQLAGNTERYLEDFEGQDAGAMVVADDTYGVVELSNDGTAIFKDSEDDTGPFTRFDGYRTDTSDVLTTSIQIYLDPDAADGTGRIAGGEGFSYSVAANDQEDAHIQDYIFNVARDDEGLFVNTSTGTNFDPVADISGKGGVEIEDAGWYTFEHRFFNDEGYLGVDLEVYDAGGESVFSNHIDAADGGSLVNFDDVYGGNRYGWFTNIDVAEGVQVDNWALSAQYFNEVI